MWVKRSMNLPRIGRPGMEHRLMTAGQNVGNRLVAGVAHSAAGKPGGRKT